MKSIGAGEVPELLVFNKVDLLAGAEGPGAPPDGAARIVAGADGVAAQAWVSAATGNGLDELRAALARAAKPNQVRRTLHVDLCAAALRSDLYHRNAIRAERQCDDGSWDLDVELDSAELAKASSVRGVDLVEKNGASRKQRVA